MTTKHKILVIDDEPDFIEMIKMRLEAEGYEVGVAYNGTDGLKVTQSFKPDLIILDIMMPKMDGYQVCSFLKHDMKARQIPIIMLTAKGTPQDEDVGFKAGANIYMTKPFASQKLFSNIKKLLEKKDL